MKHDDDDVVGLSATHPSFARRSSPAASGSVPALPEESVSEADSITTRDYSLPSSFGGEGNIYCAEICAENKSMTSSVSSSTQPQAQTERMQEHQQQVVGIDDDHPNEGHGKNDRVGNAEDDAASEDQLAARISKETETMMHLVRLLKEMDDGNGNYHAGSGDPKGRALASLLHDFENEISMIEHRVKDEYLIMNGEQPPLPKNWIALEDPGSGDIYYANEETGKLRLCMYDQSVINSHVLLCYLCFLVSILQAKPSGSDQAPDMTIRWKG